MKTKDYVIIGLSLACIVLGYIIFNKPVKVEDSFSQRRLDSIAVENRRLNEKINFREEANNHLLIQVALLQKSYDSLEQTKIKYIHDIKFYENYKSSDIKSSADSMRSILSKIGVH